MGFCQKVILIAIFNLSIHSIENNLRIDSRDESKRKRVRVEGEKASIRHSLTSLRLKKLATTAAFLERDITADLFML